MKKPQQSQEKENLSPETIEILERITDAFFLIDRTGKVVYLNKQAEIIFQKKRSELLGKNLDQVYPEAIGTDVDIQAQKALTTLKPSHFEAYFQPLAIWVEIDMYPSKSGMSVYFRDITKRKEIQQQLLFQSTILQNVRESVAVVNMKGELIYWNKGAERMYGYFAQEVLGLTPEFMYPDPKKETIKGYIEEIIKGKTYVGEVQRKTKKGNIIWVEIFTSSLRSHTGEILGTMGISRDITKEKKAMERIRYLANLVDQVSDTIISTDANRNIVSWNKAAEKLYGWKEKEVLGKPALNVLALEKDIPYKEKLYRQVFQKGEWRGEIMHKKKNGASIPIYSTVSRIFDVEGNLQGLVSINTDITEQKALEERKNDFIAMASHELKTPLTSLRIYTRLFGNIIQKDEHAISYLAKMEHDLDRLQQLIADLLDISKMQQGKLPLQYSKFDLYSLIKETVEFIRKADSKHPIIILQNKKMAIRADKEKINQVMINLLSNASKYSPEESPITIAITKGKDAIQVEVKDNGIGIAKKYQENIFERFFRVTEKKELQTYEGLGIGLYICKEIIKAHRGNMWVESKEGKGSSFCFTLPLKSEQIASASAKTL